MFRSRVWKAGKEHDFLIDNITPKDYETLVFPKNIDAVVIEGDYLDELIVPEGVKNVVVADLSLRKLVIPDSVIWLNCENNCLTELELPGGIEYVDAHNNFLTRLEFRSPPLELGRLDVKNNRLTKLDFETTSNLYGLNIMHNRDLVLSRSLQEFLATHECE